MTRRCKYCNELEDIREFEARGHCDKVIICLGAERVASPLTIAAGQPKGRTLISFRRVMA